MKMPKITKYSSVPGGWRRLHRNWNKHLLELGKFRKTRILSPERVFLITFFFPDVKRTLTPTITAAFIDAASTIW